jgi:acetyltransferase-like isoleucine patch superfamily enzyme
VFHDNIVKLHELTGQPQQALQCLDRALQALPGQAPWWVRRGVLLGAGAKVLGNIEIGACAKIAAGSVVLDPVPAGCTAARSAATAV